MSRNLCTRATPRWQAPGIRTVAGQRVTAQSTRTVDPGELLDPQVIRQVEEELQDWLLAEERKVKKDCSTCYANGANDR